MTFILGRSYVDVIAFNLGAGKRDQSSLPFPRRLILRNRTAEIIALIKMAHSSLNLVLQVLYLKCWVNFPQRS